MTSKSKYENNKSFIFCKIKCLLLYNSKHFTRTARIFSCTLYLSTFISVKLRNIKLTTIFLSVQFGMFETMTTAFVDEFPEYLRQKKMLFTAGICFIEFLLGIPFVTQVITFNVNFLNFYLVAINIKKIPRI